MALVARDEMGIDVRDLKIRMLGSHIGMENRQIIQDLWGAPCYDSYGTHENGTVATECKLQNGMHINDDALVIEIIDPETGMVQPDGRVRSDPTCNDRLKNLPASIGGTVDADDQSTGVGRLARHLQLQFTITSSTAVSFRVYWCCPCRKLALVYIGGASRPKLARPTCGRRSGRRGESVHFLVQ
jgi:hypothetical protein